MSQLIPKLHSVSAALMAAYILIKYPLPMKKLVVEEAVAEAIIRITM